MTPKSINTVIFDLGGVLVDWNPRYLYRKLFSTEEEVEHFLTKICTTEWNEEQDAGRPIAEANQILVQQFPEYKDLIEAYYGRWPEMLGGVIEGTERILRQLHADQQFRLVALTNWSHETFPIAEKRFDFLQLFEGILVSGREKMKKPDPAIYQLLFKRYQLEPTKCIFIDDNAANIESAGKLGIQTIHFQGPDKLASTLQKWGVIHQ